MANKNLGEAKIAKNDEFYTQYEDIQKEVNAYLEYDPNVFRGKTILLPCDDPEWSNFTRFFAQNVKVVLSETDDPKYYINQFLRNNYDEIQAEKLVRKMWLPEERFKSFFGDDRISFCYDGFGSYIKEFGGQQNG